MAPKKKCTDLALYLARTKNSPREVTVHDVDSWAELRVQQGVTYKLVNLKKGRFWGLLRDCKANNNLPRSVTQATGYGIPLEQFPQSLRGEVERLLKWKTADFSPDRPKGGQIRQVTANTIQVVICRILGFAVNIRGMLGITTLQQLITKEIVSDYVAWCINERFVKGMTLQTHLGRLEVALRQHPSYSSANFSWFKTLLDSLPIEAESERRMRKGKKYLDYSILEAIPGKIRAQRLSLSKDQPTQIATLAMLEFLIRWMIALPWRRRNIRECRIRGSNPNIFKAKIPTHITIDKPLWVQSQQQMNPDAEFWQMHFTAKETKTGREIRAVLPRPLIELLEEYLSKFRPELVKAADPGTLFVQKDGRPMGEATLYNLVSRITSQHGGRHVNPHLFRDIVAFAWLKEHPKDFLTLSKILWHANINVTLKTYGSQFDESSGVCAMETWLEERSAKAKQTN